MHETDATHRSRRRLWFVLTGVALTLLVGGLVARHHHVKAQWARMRGLATAALSAYEARDGARPPLYGVARSGNAFDGYARAFALASSPELEPAREELEALLDDAAARPDLAAWRSALEALHEAARCDRAVSLADVRKGFEMPLLDLPSMLDLVRAACLDGRSRIHAGPPREGLHRLLDALALATDLTTSAVLIEQLVGFAQLQSIATAGFGDATLDRLGADDLQMLAEALQRADDRVPTCASPSGDVLLWGQQLVGSELRGGADFELPVWQSWRHGFSVRLMAAESWLRMHEYAKTMDAAWAETWPKRKARYEAYEAELDTRANPFLRLIGGNHKLAEEQMRTALTHLRLLRSVVAARLGTPLELDDPLGTGRLSRQEVGDRVRHTGIGADAGAISRDAPRR